LDARVLEEKWPVLGWHERAVEWLRAWAGLGRAPRTIDAYARGLAEYLGVCDRVGVDPLAAGRAHIAAYVRDLSSRPSRRGAGVVAIDSGSGLANATLQPNRWDRMVAALASRQLGRPVSRKRVQRGDANLRAAATDLLEGPSPAAGVLPGHPLGRAWGARSRSWP
jgi:hypothetical protein